MSKLGKRVSKLTVKAAQAIAEGANNLKQKASSSGSSISFKKKPRQSSVTKAKDSLEQNAIVIDSDSDDEAHTSINSDKDLEEAESSDAEIGM
jgi:hypothetical protein